MANIRQFHIDALAGTGIEPIIPLWQIPTMQLAIDMQTVV